MHRYVLLSLFLLLRLQLFAQFIPVWVQTECDSPVTGYSRLEDLWVDEQGNVIVAGSIDTALSIGPVYMAYSPGGQLLWKKSIAALNFNYCYRLLAAPNGNYFFTGEYEDNSGTNNMFYSELDASGDRVAGGDYDSPAVNSGDDLHDIAGDVHGSLYLSGSIQSGSNFYSAIVRYDSGGVFRWMSYYPLLAGWNSAEGRSIELIGDTGMYQLIFNFTGYGSLVYCDSGGTFQWQRQLPISLSDYHTQLAVDSNGNAIAGGRMGQTAGIVKVDPRGDTMWSRVVAFPGLSALQTEVTNIITDGDGSIYVLAINLGNPGYSILAAFDSSGLLHWQDTLRGFFTIYGRNKEFFQLEDGVLTVSTNKGVPWLYRFTTAGIRITDAALVIPGIVSPEVSAIDYFNGDLYITGTGYAGFNTRQGFTARLGGFTAIHTAPGKKVLEVFPNPSGDFVTIRTGLTGEYRLLIYDYSGRSVLQLTLTDPTASIDVQSLASGMYAVQISSATEHILHKLIVQH